MKTQIRVQKILMLVSLVVSALVFVYALSFMTGGLADVYRYIDNTTKKDYIHCADFVSASQDFVSTLVILAIIMIVSVAVMYLMACSSRRKYYITNYIAIGVFVVFALVVAIYMVVKVANVMDLYKNGILWDVGEGEAITRIIEKPDGSGYEVLNLHANYAEQARFYPDYPLDPNQSYNFILGFILFVIVIVDAVCVALCTAWKVLLMKGEKKLLVNDATNNNGASEEAPAEEVVSGNSDDPVGEPVKEEE